MAVGMCGVIRVICVIRLIRDSDTAEGTGTHGRRAGQFEVFAEPLVLTFARQAGLRTDFDGNGSVGFQDFLLFASHYGYAAGHANYDVRYDLDGDGQIGFGDFLIFVQDYGQS